MNRIFIWLACIFGSVYSYSDALRDASNFLYENDKWTMAYHEDGFNFTACTLTVNIVYEVAALKYQVPINKYAPPKGNYEQHIWVRLPDQIVRTDCNGYGNNISIFTTDYGNY